MKKIALVLAMVMITAVAVGCLVACGEKGGIEGTYSVSAIRVGEKTITVDDDNPMLALYKDWKMTIKSGGTAEATISGATQEGTWTLSEDGLVLTVVIDGEGMDFDVDDGSLIMSMGDDTMKIEIIFEK